jgi:transcriptional repressor NrdR
MYCLFCQNKDTEVIETRTADDGKSVRRRRQCLKCGKRFTTYERSEEFPILVIKRDRKRERFNREKLREGIVKACEKTDISLEKIEKIIDEIENEVREKENAEIESTQIGNMVAKRLKKLNKVAYIRFSSVFRRFLDVEDFEAELKKLI